MQKITTRELAEILNLEVISGERGLDRLITTDELSRPALQLAGGFSGEGLAISEADVKALAGLPSKDQLVAQVVSQLLSPVHDTVNALGGNLHGLLDGIEAKATA